MGRLIFNIKMHDETRLWAGKLGLFAIINYDNYSEARTR